MKSTLARQLGQTCILLGAGATRDTSLQPGPDHPLPPLDRDFFTQVQRIKSKKHLNVVDRLLEYCYQEFGPSWDLTMERFFNHIWYSGLFHEPRRIKLNMPHGTDPDGTQRYVARQVDIVDLFKQALLAVLEESLYGEHSQDCRSRTCELHDALAQNLQHSDTIITFNYDCVVDCSLARHSPLWDPARSYGFQPLPDAAIAYWRSALRDPAAGLIKLFKLHGSINWQESGDTFKLTSRPYTKQRGIRHFYIVPPVQSKEQQILESLGGIWKEAAKSLAQCKTLCVFGYSVPEIDPLANVLLRSRHRAGGTSLRYLILADPSAETRRRVRNLLRKSITQSTRVLVFNKFRDAVAHVLPGT